MDKVAIITAAGYKGVSTQFGLGACPEPLLPFGDTTILGRQVKQLKRLGYQCYVSVGKPGCLYPWASKWAPKALKFNDGQPLEIMTPWTRERIDYVKSLGVEVVVIDEPDGKTAQDSICIILDKIGYDWKKLVISCGDHVYTDALLEMALGRSFPYQLRQSNSPKRYNALFMLTPETARLFRQFAQTHRKRGMRSWFGNNHHEYGDYKIDGRASGEIFAESVPLLYVNEDFPINHYEWPGDIDEPGGYRFALKWLYVHERDRIYIAGAET